MQKTVSKKKIKSESSRIEKAGLLLAVISCYPKLSEGPGSCLGREKAGGALRLEMTKL